MSRPPAGRDAGRPGAWLLVPLLPLLPLLVACGGPRGIPVEGRVTRQDGRAVAGGEVWLEPEDGDAAPLRAVRRPITDGRFSFPASDGVQPGRWTVRVYPPSLGSGASDAEVESLFEPRHQSITISRPAAPGTVSLEFTVGPLRSAEP